MKEQSINEHRSIEIISQMIADTSANIDRVSGKYFLLWGYTTVIVSLFEYVAQVNNILVPLLLWCWFLIPIIGGIGTIMINYNQKKKGATTPKSYIDRSISAVWMVFGLSYVMVYIAAMVYHTNILFLTSVLMGMGTAITGLICRHKILSVAGFAGIALSLLFPVRHLYLQQMGESIYGAMNIPEWLLYGDILWFSLIFAVMMVIPGHKLRYRAKHNNNA